tara:strand:+ start:21976 stop:22281 length:306 start_codon:yes stop_codon:yes gene_type:complete
MELKKSTVESKKEETFVQSIRLFSPNESAPDYAIADMVVDLEKLTEEFETMKSFAASDKKVRMQVRRSKKGIIYSVFNEYYKGKQIKSRDHSPDREDDLPI